MKKHFATAVRGGVRVLGLALMVSALSGVSFAGFDVPEIDPGSLASGLTLLTGGLLMVTGRRRRSA